MNLCKTSSLSCLVQEKTENVKAGGRGYAGRDTHSPVEISKICQTEAWSASERGVGGPGNISTRDLCIF